jgi:cell division protease FtsH
VLSHNMVKMKAQLAMAFGGRIAEQLIYGEDELNTGAASDIQQASAIARAMVTEYGMSKKLGWLRYKSDEDFGPFGGGGRAAISGETAKLIDSEVRALIEEAEKTARKVLTDKLDDLHTLANALLEYETLSGEEAKLILAGEKLDRSSNDDGKPVAIDGHAGSIPQVRRRPPSKSGDARPQGA